MNIKSIRTATQLCGQSVTASGWVRTLRKQKKISFIELNDGSSVKNLQIIAPPTAIPSNLAVGSSLQVTGELKEGLASHGGELEIHAQEGQLNVIGSVESSYPLQKKYHSLEFLREHLHLRSRTNTASAILRTRHHISSAVRNYLNDSNFIEVHTPIITSNDCEGAGELFGVGGKNDQKIKNKSDNEEENTFFDTSAYLTVSGQIHAEALACSMSRVYTFGPTFRAENSNTSRHLCEFWMIEPELSFADMNDAIDVAQGTLQATFQHVLDHCSEELDFFSQKRNEKGNNNAKNNSTTSSSVVLPTPRELLEISCSSALNNNFARMTYTQAIELLSHSTLLERPLWGADLNSEQERWLVEHHCNNTPLIVTDYPKDIKPFYMRSNDDGKTVAAFDILFPGVGEIVGGSGREERLDYLENAMQKKAVNGLDWYVDLRRHGTVPHAGFGIGFERLLMSCTGVKNVRDCIPFPRTPGSCPA